MKLDQSIHEGMRPIRWFAACGKMTPLQCGLPIRFVRERPMALQTLFSTQWANATTEAQGKLTGYLAKTDYAMYGSTWNNLAKESRSILEARVGPSIQRAIDDGDWESSTASIRLPGVTHAVRASLGTHMAELLEAGERTQFLFATTLVNLNRGCLEMTYRRQYRKTPAFFECLFRVYEAGHMPCGWEGNLDEWPEGILLVH